MIYNKKGAGVSDILLMIIVVFCFIVAFGGFIYGFNIITETLGDIDDPINTDSNETISSISEDTFGQGNTAIGLLRFVGVCIFFGLIIAIFLTSFLQRSHPVFFIFYVLLLIVIFIISILLSNAYDVVRSDEILGSTFQSFTILDFFMLYLPYFVSIIGFLAGIVLYGLNLNDGGVM